MPFEPRQRLSPFNETVIGTCFADSPLFTWLPERPFGTATIRSYANGVGRAVGSRRVSDYPLVIFSAVNSDEVLSTWRRNCD
ncbi:hypothetical protein [Pseudomonas jessenii]|uniref:hypothetical protein n=1 Tax=Pseudomonas jessenii TaxID=77298 RepID=UPI003892C09A